MEPSEKEDAGRWRALQGSIRMEMWMEEIQGSSSWTVEVNSWEKWKDLMLFFQYGDVSGFEHLKLVISGWFGKPTEADRREDPYGFGFILREGRFSSLKRLDIRCFHRQPRLGVGSASLARAFRTGHYTSLRELHLSYEGAFDFNDLFEALVEGRVSQLTSFSMDTYGKNLAADEKFDASEALVEGRVFQLTSFSMDTYDKGLAADEKFDALLKSHCLKNLTHLKVHGCKTTVFGDMCVNGIKSGLLPNVVSLSLHQVSLCGADLSGLVGAPGNWFGSLKELTLRNCEISTTQLCVVVEAIMKHPESGLALEILNLRCNYLDNDAIEALVILVESRRLPQLRKLDLSRCRGVKSREGFIRLMGRIQKGLLPRLEVLRFQGNPTSGPGDKAAGAEAVMQAYLENEFVTAYINTNWDDSDRSLEAKADELMRRNARLVALRNEMEGEFKVLSPLTSAKVFLCGFAEVGKTTLRKSLGKQLGLSTKLKWERRPKLVKEPRTKGIELRHIKNKKGTRLMLWDLAGQEEFHVLHGTFFTDWGFAGGKATTFVVVFKLLVEEDTEAKLLYWLKLLASSSNKPVKRQVLIVLNRFHGNECLDSDKTYWKRLIQTCAEKFDDILQIHRDLVIIDARVAASVQALKDQLFTHAETLLHDVMVPRACFRLLKDLKQWSKGMNKERLPIFSWKAFEERWKLMHGSKQDPPKNLKVCASYLHEIGEIIYLDEQESTHPRSGNKRIVVSDPEWFCKQVVGQLLLPKGMLEGDRSIEVSADGTISPLKFEAFFKHLLPDGTESDDVISMLQQLGLCYRKGLEKIVIPALIRKDEFGSLGWEREGFDGVVGRCLAVDDMDRCAIPETLFRRLQVELAIDPDLGGRSDSDYRAGKSYSTFNRGHLRVLVQFDLDSSDPKDDRIDILVKSVLREDSRDARLAKVNCICEIIQRLERLCVTWCPGLAYAIKVIEPWNAKEQTPKFTSRKLMSLAEIKSLLVKKETHLGWELNHCPVEIKTLLSTSELEERLGMVQREYEDWKHTEVSLGRVTEDTIHEFEQKFAQGPVVEGATDTLCARVEKIEELMQALLSFSIEEKKNVVPRFLVLKKKDCSGSWTSFTDGIKVPIQSEYRLHFLCESQFDDGSLHWVEEQEGLKLSKGTALKEWLKKVEPGVRWSVFGAIAVAKIALTHFAPGTAGAVPTISTSTKEHDKPRDIAVKMMHTDETIHDRNSANMAGQLERCIAQVHGRVGTSDDVIDVKTKLIAPCVVSDLIKDFGMAKFVKGTRLRRVLLKAPPQHAVGCSQPASSVLWICVDCLKKYGEERATDITPYM